MKKIRKLPGFRHGLKLKFSLKMKLSLILVIGMFFQMQAETGVGQENRISLELKSTSILKVIETIESNSDYRFFYSKEGLNLYRKVSIHVQNEKIERILKEIFESSDISFKIIDRQIILKRKLPDKLHSIRIFNDIEPIPLSNLTMVETLFSINGIVENENGEPLIGVNIQVKGTNQGTATDLNGRFELSNVNENTVLIASYIGYRTQEVTLNGETNLVITLLEDSQTLDEIVVVGYGAQKRVNLTGAVSTVSGEELENRVMASPVEGLQGMVPNLNVSVTNSGGEPGAKRNINIRGVGSLSGGGPYVLVDGVEQDLYTVNPDDIESISVLKGAAASAIYGAHGPYGVILVTTKKGSNGKAKFSYKTNFGWNMPTVLPQKVNSLLFAETYNEAAINSNRDPYFNDETIQRIKNFMKDPDNTPGTIVNPNSPNEWAGWYSSPYLTNSNTDWYKVYFRPTAMNQTHNLNISGGGERIGYYISGGLYDQGGQFRYGDESYKRYNVTSNVHTEITNWLDVDVKTKFNNRHIDMPYTPSGIGTYYHDAVRKWPTVPVYDPNGYILDDAIGFMSEGGRNIDDDNLFLGSFQFDIKPTKNWIINADFSYRLNLNSGTSHKKQVNGHWVDKTPYPFSKSIPTVYSTNKNVNTYRTSNVYTSYVLEKGSHFLKGMMGFQIEEFNYSDLTGNKSELVTDEVPSISTATGEDNVYDSKGHWSTEGAFTRLSYNFAEKYLFEFNARYDGSSRFPEGKRYGFFPSLSAGYNIAEESFWDGFRDVVSMLKVRTEYGTLGNQDVANYLYIPNLGIHTNLSWLMDGERPIYVTSPALISDNLTWETSTTFGMGLDMEMFRQHLLLNFDWFQRNTTNMFGPVKTYPGVLGTSAPQENNANLLTKGFELSLSWRDYIGDFEYQADIMLADNQSSVTKYRNDIGYLGDYYAGRQIGEIWGYTSEGLYQSDAEAENDPIDQSQFWSVWRAGDVKYKDINGDGKINRGDYTLDDHGDLKVIGNTSPRYSYSLRLSGKWKMVDLSIFCQGIGKRDIWPGSGTNGIFWGFTSSGTYQQSTVLEQHLDHFNEDNPDAYFPKPYVTSENGKNQQVQTRYLQKANYFRLKNLQIGYTLPHNWLKKVNINSLRLYCSGENLLTFSPIIGSLDPEATGSVSGYGSGKLYPLAKTISMGLNINF